MRPTIAIAMSGGVDSLMAAYLLKQKGYPVFGIHFITGFEITAENTATGRSDASDNALAPPFSSLAGQLDIKIETVDCSRAFRKAVVDYFANSYRNGQTPNPCMVCNPRIKFGTVLKAARKRGADYLATGHYARVSKDASGTHHLFKGVDRQKDQSYFLARLGRDQLTAARFPLGTMTKAEVRRSARRAGLMPVVQEESQDICFIRKTGYREFLARHYGIGTRPGDIVDTQGQVVGRHQGLHRYTVGQRRGINCPAPAPYYVVRIDGGCNRLVVGSQADLVNDRCELVNMNWIGDPPRRLFEARVRVRYRSEEAAAEIAPLNAGSVRVRFEKPQAALTPGQGGVVYAGEEILGGGWIQAEH